MSAELATIEEIKEENYPAIYGKGGLDQFYEKVKAEVSNEVPDLTTAKGRARIASLAAKVSKSKTAVESPGRAYLKQLKDLPKTIEKELREFVDSMDALRDEVRKPLTDWENAEKVRVERHKEKISHIVSYRDARTDVTAAQMGALIETLEDFCVDQAFEEFEAEAHREKAESLVLLREAHLKQKNYEAAQAELARLRAEAEERARKDREEQIARDAAEKAKREAEEAALLEMEKAEAAAKAEREASERRELELKLAAEQAVRQKLAAEQAQKAAEEAQAKAEQEAKSNAEQAARDAEERVKREAEENAKAEAAELAKREADKKHRAKINNEAVDAFVEGGFSEAEAKRIVVMVASGRIPNVKISY